MPEVYKFLSEKDLISSSKDFHPNREQKMVAKLFVTIFFIFTATDLCLD
jgi:hypothetical protein